MTAHSRIAPSSAGVFRYCAASVQMQERYPETERSDAALEGDAVHWVCAEVLMGRIIDAAHLIGSSCGNGVIITKQMAFNAQTYIDAVRSVAVATGGDLHIEEPVACRRIHAESFGTPDAWLFDPKTATLYIWDFKNGYGLVEAAENWQLINYFSGILDLLPTGAELCVQVCFCIVQPNPHHPMGPVRYWQTPADGLRAHVNQLHNSAHAALLENPVATSGEHCRNCTARHACLSAEKAAQYAVDVAETYGPWCELSPTAIGVELAVLTRAAKALEYRRVGLEAEALALIKAGQTVPGWGPSSGLGRVTWDRPASEVIAMGDALGVDVRKPLDALTPKQAEGAGLSPDVVAAYSSASPAKLKLVSKKSTLATSIFGGN